MLIGRNGRAIKKLLHKSTRVLEDLYKRPIDLKIQSTLMNAAMAKAAEKGKPVNVDHPRIVSSIRLEESIHQSMLPLNND